MRLFRGILFAFVMTLTACGDNTTSSAKLPATENAQASTRVAKSETADAACGQGGSSCPAGLECEAYRDGQALCVPTAVPAVVLLKDATRGGSCLMASAADRFPGISIASVEVLAMDRSFRGRGRLVWDKAGYEVAANRGVAPDGVQFIGDICTDAYNLGCDGIAVFEIVDETGTVLKLREGEHLVVQTRGKETCGEEFADGVEGKICLDPAAAATGDLTSCTWPLPLGPLNKSQYGPDRFGGTLGTVLMQ